MRNYRKYSRNFARTSLELSEGCGSKKKGGRRKPMREHRNLHEGLDGWSLDSFIEDIKYDIRSDSSDEEINDLIRDAIDNAVIYYSDQFKIAWALNLTSWEDADYDITSMGQLAAWGLEDAMYNGGGYSELIDYRDDLIDEEDEEDY